MFAVGVGNAVEDELREIASEPVAEHYFYTADFRTISKIGKKLQMKICIGESEGLGRRADLVTGFSGWKQEDKTASSNGCCEQLSVPAVSTLQGTWKDQETSTFWVFSWTTTTPHLTHLPRHKLPSPSLFLPASLSSSSGK